MTGFVVRLNTDGSLDQSFQRSDEPNTVFAALTILDDGKILMVKGNFPYYFASQATISRLNANGSLDTTFNSGTGANGNINTLQILPDGQFLVGGKFTTLTEKRGIIWHCLMPTVLFPDDL